MNLMSATARFPSLVTAGRLQAPEPLLVQQVKARFMRETAAALPTSCFAPDAVARLRAVVADGNPDRLADAVAREIALDVAVRLRGRTVFTSFGQRDGAATATPLSLERCLRNMRWRALPVRRTHWARPQWRQVLEECRVLFPWPEAHDLLMLSGYRLFDTAEAPNIFLELETYWKLRADAVSAGMAWITRLGSGVDFFACVPTSIDRYLHAHAGVALLGCPVWGRVSNRLLNALHAVGYRAEAHAVAFQRYDEDSLHHPCRGLWHDRLHRDTLNGHSRIWTALRSVFLEAWYQYYPWYAQLCHARGEPLVPLATIEAELRVDSVLDGDNFYQPTTGLTIFEEVPSAMAVYRLAVAETYLRAADEWGVTPLHPVYTKDLAREHDALREQLARKAPDLLALVPVWLANPHVFDPMTM